MASTRACSSEERYAASRGPQLQQRPARFRTGLPPHLHQLTSGIVMEVPISQRTAYQESGTERSATRKPML